MTVAAEVDGLVGYALLTISTPGLDLVTSWSFDRVLQPYLNAVWASSVSEAFAVGAAGMIPHYDCTAWTEMSSGTDLRLKAVCGSFTGDVLAFGEYGLILRGRR